MPKIPESLQGTIIAASYPKMRVLKGITSCTREYIPRYITSETHILFDLVLLASGKTKVATTSGQTFEIYRIEQRASSVLTHTLEKPLH